METATQTLYKIDTMHSEVQFKVKHLVISTVSGTFNSFEGSLETENENFDGAKASFSIDTNSVDTNVGDRDKHLKSADFFDVENYPEITFLGKLRHKEGDRFDLIGNLKIKDYVKEVRLDAIYGGSMVDGYGQNKAGFEINGILNRKEFGLNWSQVTEAGGLVVGEDVRIQLNIQVTEQKED